MTRTIYAVVNEHDSLKQFLLNNEQGLTASTGQHSSTQRGSLTYQARSPLVVEWPTAVSEIWISGMFGATSNLSATGYPLIAAYSASGVDQFAIRATTSRSITLARNISGTLTNLTPAIDTQTELRAVTAVWPLLVHFKVGNPGRIRVYFYNTLMYEWTGDYSAMSDMKGIRLHSQQTNAAQRVGRLVVANCPIFLHDFDTLRPNASGNSSDWDASGHTKLAASGPIGLSSGLGMMNPYDPIWTNSTGQKQLMNFENMGSVPANQGIYGVSIAAIGSIDSAATPTAIELLARHASTDYTLDDMVIVPGDGYMSYQQFLTTNPAGGAWNTTDINAIQFGVTT